MVKNKMKVLVAFERDNLDLVEIDIPEPDDYEVLVKNEGCVFCNTTDRMIVKNLFATPAYPVAIGHECFGHVVKVGKKVKKYKIGDRVICANAIVNGYNGTYYSSWGGFSEYGIAGDYETYLADHGGSLDKENAYRRRYRANQIISNDLTMEEASLAFPLAEASSAIKQVGEITGKTVVILGTGIVGFFFTYFAKQYGAKNVIVFGIDKDRFPIAEKLGADKTFVDRVAGTEYINSLGGADIVFECCGNWRVFEDGIPYLKEGGMLACFAVPKQPYSLDLLKCPNGFVYKRIDPIVRNTIGEMCELLKAGKVPVDIFISHKWNFDEAPEAFKEVEKGNVIKGLIYISKNKDD